MNRDVLGWIESFFNWGSQLGIWVTTSTKLEYYPFLTGKYHLLLCSQFPVAATLCPQGIRLETQVMPCESLHWQLPAISVGLTLGVASIPRIPSSSPNALLRFDPDTALQEAPHCLNSAATVCPKTATAFTKLCSESQASFALSDTSYMASLLGFYTLRGSNRMKGRLARCKWVPFDYLKHI